MNVAIIPARSGSTRIPQKNIRSFLGKPMISYPIKTIQKSKVIDKIIVSTDDEKIAKIAKNFGALVPFIRPRELSDDFTPTVPVIAHATKFLIESGYDIENVCCVCPCTPLLKYDIIDDCYENFIAGQHEFAFPVVVYPHPIQRAMRMLESRKMEFMFREYELTRTQDLEKMYHDAAQFYWGTAEAWMTGKKMHSDGIGVPIESWKVVDIDDEEDWRKAELLKDLMNKQDLR